MEKVLIYRKGGQVPQIKCPLVGFPRPVGSCMTRCEDDEAGSCQAIKEVSIEELDEAAKLMKEPQQEQWQERRDFIATVCGKATGGEDEPKDAPEETPDDPDDEDPPRGPYDGESESTLEEEGPDEDDHPTEEEDGAGEAPDTEEEKDEGENDMAEENDDKKASKKKAKTNKKKKKKDGRGRKPHLKDTYILVCASTARILEKMDPSALLKEAQKLRKESLELLNERLEELDGEEDDIEFKAASELVTKLENGGGVRIFQVIQELQAQVKVELVPA